MGYLVRKEAQKDLVKDILDAASSASIPASPPMAGGRLAVLKFCSGNSIVLTFQ